MASLSFIPDFIGKSVRVLHVCYRPSEAEFARIAKITLAGMVLIGAIGVGLAFIFSVI